MNNNTDNTTNYKMHSTPPTSPSSSNSRNDTIGKSLLKIGFGFILGFFFRPNFEVNELRQVFASAAGGVVRSSAQKTGFDAIVATAYKVALEEEENSPQTALLPRTPKNAFNITWWETESGLTTQGGLQTADRILLAEIYGRANSVFEYGLGESTYMANYVGVPRYAGIDSDPVWVGMARDKVDASYRFYLGDIGATKMWGYPNALSNKQVLNYQLSPLIVEPKAFDVYMVDGRWRVPCLIATFLHASARGAAHQDTTVLIHDCPAVQTSEKTDESRKGRQAYRTVDHLLQLTNHSGHFLCVYKRKPDTTDAQLVEAWHTYMNAIGR